MKALVLQNVRKVYPKNLIALQGIDLTVEEGDFFALLGPNGAGKTTTIGIITSLVNKTSGLVSIFGNDIDKNSIAAKTCIGVVPQEFNFNVFEKVIDIVINQAGYYGIPRSIAYQRAEYYLTQLGLWEKRHQVSMRLSGGMKRRLMIARALVHQPRMLILDEPTAGVDIELRRSMWSFLREINHQGVTIILTTHYLEEAESLCRGIAIINKGKIIESTTIKKLLSRLNTETVILDLKYALEKIPKLFECEVKQLDNLTLEITFPKKRSLNEIFQDLSQQHIEVISMRNKSNRLEELFVNLVNHEKS